MKQINRRAFLSQIIMGVGANFFVVMDLDKFKDSAAYIHGLA